KNNMIKGLNLMVNKLKAYRFPIILIISIMIGAIIGLIFGEKATIIKPFGDVFINLLFMVVFLLVFFSFLSVIVIIYIIFSFLYFFIYFYYDLSYYWTDIWRKSNDY